MFEYKNNYVVIYIYFNTFLINIKIIITNYSPMPFC